jgi:lipopolysaccharide biosynthesis protein
MRLIALYLPQFYPTPYNDAWWGSGYTEWTAAKRATPQFEGHFQPKIPTKLGYYDLRNDDAREKQAELARQYNIHGFCYYYYRFNGKRALEQPLNQMLATGRPDFPFCICWANENWTRRWDGRDNEVLMKQYHNDKDDLEFITEIAPMLMDKRYIRVNGKPLLMIYRTELWQDIKKTTQMWREYMRKHHSTEIYLVRCNGFEADRIPEFIGFDAAYQFPPLQFRGGNEMLANVKPVKGFQGGVHDYKNWPRFVSQERPYKLFRGVMTAWDNTPRRKNKGHIFYGSSPQEYQKWLDEALSYTKKNFTGDERMIFLNAWNEWGEGAILEPSNEYGLQYLEVTNESYKNA